MGINFRSFKVYLFIFVPILLGLYYYHRTQFIELENKYQELERSLQKQEWGNSDEITFDILLQVVNQTQLIEQRDIAKIPCQHLQRLDSLWQKYSDNRFGFSSQHQIWQEMGGSVNKDMDNQMADKMGWLYSENTLYNYNYQMLDVSLESPFGHLPFIFYCCLNWDANKTIWFDDHVVLSSLAQRYDQCLIQ